LAFSAKFAMTGMTGTFNSTVQSQIAGQATAPIVSPTGVNGGAAASPASSTPTQTSSTASNLKTVGSSTTTGTGSAPSSSQSSGARELSASVFAAVAGVVAVAFVHHAL
jgi:hypothetical protein